MVLLAYVCNVDTPDVISHHRRVCIFPHHRCTNYYVVVMVRENENERLKIEIDGEKHCIRGNIAILIIFLEDFCYSAICDDPSAGLTINEFMGRRNVHRSKFSNGYRVPSVLQAIMYMQF